MQGVLITSQTHFWEEILTIFSELVSVLAILPPMPSIVAIMSTTTHICKRHLLGNSANASSCDVPQGEDRVGVEYAQQRRNVVREPRGAPLAVRTVSKPFQPNFSHPVSKLYTNIIFELPISCIMLDPHLKYVGYSLATGT